MTIRDSIHRSLTRLGSANGSKLPDGADNYGDPLLHEFYVAAEIQSHAKKRYDMAKKNLIAWGEFDPNSVTPGSEEILVSGKSYVLSLKVNNAPEKVDMKRFVTELVKQGVSDDLIKSAVQKATSKGTPAKVYKVLPLT